MSHEVEREIVVEAEPGEVWRSLTEPEHMDGWLGEDAEIDLRPGGDFALTDPVQGRRCGWVEAVEPERRLALWWATEADEESSRVEFELERAEAGTVLRVVESRPLSDLVVPTAMALT